MDVIKYVSVTIIIIVITIFLYHVIFVHTANGIISERLSDVV